MKKYLVPSIKMTFVMLVLCCVVYFALVSLIGKAAPGGGHGETVSVNGKVVGYERIGQSFTADRYFWGRPSAVSYNAAGSGGSNKGPSNPDYLQIVQERIDTFLAHNPGVEKARIPAEMVTASGSGLDPNISPASANIQVNRVARARGLDAMKVQALVDQYVETNPVGPNWVHVLRLNVALDAMR